MKRFLTGLSIITLFLLSACTGESVYKIGFSGTLSGNFGSVGVSEMYGAEMAITEINESGGINGRQVELVVRDDGATKESAVQADNELYDMGIDVIIGHSISFVGEEVIENANEKEILLLSPSMGSDEFTAIDDYFIRNVATVVSEAKNITDQLLLHEPSKVLFIYNLDNVILTKYHKDTFIETMSLNGYTSEDYDVVSYSSQNQSDLNLIEEKLSSLEYDTAFIVAPNTDAAPMVNYVKSNNLDVELHLSSWASIGLYSLIDTVNTDGVYLYYDFLEDDSSQEFLDFKSNYEELYGQDIDMLCVNSYDLVYALKTVIESIDSFEVNDILAEFTSGITFNGISGDFMIDSYGDTVRDNYQMIIEEGIVKYNK